MSRQTVSVSSPNLCLRFSKPMTQRTRQIAYDHDICGWPVVLAVAILSFVAPTTFADSLDERYIEGLNERQLFSLAEAHCQRVLTRQDLDTDERIDVTIALCRTYAEHALNTSRSGRAQLWAAAVDAVEQYRRASDENPRGILVEMQLALTTLARGELARQEAEIGAPGAPSLDEARRELLAADQQLEEIGERAERLLREVGRNPRALMSEQELISLQRNIAYQQARALRNQALCYPPKSPERSDSLIRALEGLGPLAKSSTADTLVWNARIDEAVCARLRGQLAEAATLLDKLEASRPPSKIALIARAERVRIYLDANRPDEAVEILKAGREINGRTSAEYDLAHVETYIAQWKKASQANDQQAAEAWQKRALAMIQVMESQYGRYWTRRGEMLLAASAGTSGSEDVEILARTAANHFVKKEFTEAIAAYSKAGEAALASGDAKRAFDLFHAAAHIERDEGELKSAVERYRSLAIKFPQHPQAALLHLQATIDAAQLARDGTSETLQAYIVLLDEHIKTWPDEASADKARLWLARLKEHQRDWATALEAYRGVSPVDEKLFRTAIDGVARCYRELLIDLRNNDQETDGPANRAARYFENILLAGDTQLPERFGPIDRQLALHAARLRLQFTEEGFNSARTLLDAALADSASADPTWRSEAYSLLVVAQAGAGNRDAAARTLAQLSDGSPSRQLDLLQGLRDIAEGSEGLMQRELALLQLEVVSRLRRDSSRLSAADRKSLDVAEAQALAWAGKKSAATDAFARLVKAYPDDGQVAKGYAQVLLEADDRQSLQLALSAWRNVLRRTRPNTPGWYEAKYSTALAHFRLGDREAAAKMIELLATVDPEMGGAQMKRKFVQLLNRCR